MGTLKNHGPQGWDREDDDEGHHTYRITHLVSTTDPDDGPAVMITTPGLPLVGQYWQYGNDVDGWAFCTPRRRVRPVYEKEACLYYEVESFFSTRPIQRCDGETDLDPLNEPQKVSGTFVKYVKEAMYDKDDNLIKTSSHEILRGPQVEFDAHRATVRIEQNAPSLQLAMITEMMNHVNAEPMWGLDARMVKLSNFTWERLIYGDCYVYYSRVFDFDIDFETFDKTAVDEGLMVLRGEWQKGSGGEMIWVYDPALDPENPQNFIRYKDSRDENSRVLLNGSGAPLEDGQDPVKILVQKYKETDFFALGIPTSF